MNDFVSNEERDAVIAQLLTIPENKVSSSHSPCKIDNSSLSAAMLRLQKQEP